MAAWRLTSSHVGPAFAFPALPSLPFDDVSLSRGCFSWVLRLPPVPPCSPDHQAAYNLGKSSGRGLIDGRHARARVGGWLGAGQRRQMAERLRKQLYVLQEIDGG